MAETQNVFVTKTQNRFLPIIQAFTDNLYQYMDRQAQLNDKIFEFNRRKQGETLSTQYMSNLKSAKSVEDITKIMGQAYTDLSSKGLNEYAGQVGQMADLKAKEIGIQKEDEFYRGNFNALSKALADNDIKYEGGVKKGKDISAIVANYTQDPKMQYQLLKNAFEVGSLKTESNLAYDSKLQHITETQSFVDPTGKTVGEPVKKDIIEAGKDYYYDTGTAQGKYDEGDTKVSGDALEKISALKYRRYENDLDNARADRRMINSLTNKSISDQAKLIELIEKQEQDAYRNRLLDFGDKLRNMNIRQKGTKNSKVVIGTPTGLGGFSIAGDNTDLALQSMLKGEKTNLYSLDKFDWRNFTKSALSSIQLSGYKNGQDVNLAGIDFYITPKDKSEMSKINERLGQITQGNPTLQQLAPPTTGGTTLNPDVLEYFKDAGMIDLLPTLLEMKNSVYNDYNPKNKNVWNP